MYRFVRLLVLGFSACLAAKAASQDTNTFYQAPGTKRMAERLQAWHREFGDSNPFENPAKVKELETELAQARDPGKRVTIQFEMAFEQLIIGEPEDALTTITNLHRDVRQGRVRLSPGDRRDIRLAEGFAYLRLAELENCVLHHNPDSCLLPIRGSGQHMHQRGAENAEAI